MRWADTLRTQDRPAARQGSIIGNGNKRLEVNKNLVSTQFVELHVLYVPDDQWDVKLNKVPAEAIERFISAGFIRCVLDYCIQ